MFHQKDTCHAVLGQRNNSLVAAAVIRGGNAAVESGWAVVDPLSHSDATIVTLLMEQRLLEVGLRGE